MALSASTTNTAVPPAEGGVLPHHHGREKPARAGDHMSIAGRPGMAAGGPRAGEYSGERRGFMAGFSPMVWLRLHAVDLLTMAAMGAIGLGVYEADPAPSRSFPVYNVDGSIAYPEFAYPHACGAARVHLPIRVLRAIPDSPAQRRAPARHHHGTARVAQRVVHHFTAAVFQVFHKWLIGGLRPHFLDVCKPDVTNLTFTGSGFQRIMYDRSICTGDKSEIDDSLESWMSGHSTAAFAGFVYLALYFNAQLKTTSDHRPAYWKLILTLAPLLGASLIAASLTVDEFHNWYDCLGGACVGTLCAVVAYRKTFAALWDFRFNHVLLPRSTSLFHRSPVGEVRFAYGAGPAEAQWPVAAEGGWRDVSFSRSGAPGDATAPGVGAV